ncbi:MAG: aminoglycoside 6-adenylyltransferase, partial [Thermomicrobiales bacterium]|nr:aminoglycoside 6-adenylyltransferase [Thermomicrobiales bacterium]
MGTSFVDNIIKELVTWGEAQSDVRAVLLTSTRATGGTIDRFSDYDVVLLCTDVAARRYDDRWLQDFGEVVISYWDDLYTDEDSGHKISGNVVYYPGTKKIDFTLWPLEMVDWLREQPALPAELDAGYEVLLDKESQTTGWPVSTGIGYRRSLPTSAEYLKLVNDFFIGVPYVVTALIRGELLSAKWVLDYDMRYIYLVPMLEWYAVVLHGDQVMIGNIGKKLRGLLPD